MGKLSRFGGGWGSLFNMTLRAIMAPWLSKAGKNPRTRMDWRRSQNSVAKSAALAMAEVKRARRDLKALSDHEARAAGVAEALYRLEIAERWRSIEARLRVERGLVYTWL